MRVVHHPRGRDVRALPRCLELLSISVVAAACHVASILDWPVAIYPIQSHQKREQSAEKVLRRYENHKTKTDFVLTTGSIKYFQNFQVEQRL